MGTWFAKYFVDGGYAVTTFDTKEYTQIPNTTPANSLIGGILGADYVMLCTPTRRTPELIRLISKEMRRGSYLIEISSEKSKVVSSLSKVPAKINPISIHPMFGPGIGGIKGQNVISVPIRDAKMELGVVKKLFAGANFVTIDSTEHDKKMALILGLPHLVNLCFASILSKDGYGQLMDKMAGPSYRVQKTISEGIMSESPDLIETIISNQDIRRYAEELWKDVGRLLTATQESKTEDILHYVNACRERISKNADLDASYKRMMRMVSVLDE